MVKYEFIDSHQQFVGWVKKADDIWMEAVAWGEENRIQNR